MAINFDKIKQKVQQLSGNGRKSSLWSPKAGNGGALKEYNIRILPWPDGNDGQPFKERSFYYNIGVQGSKPIMAPSQFGKIDPIQELINKLRGQGTPESMELCKQFYPKRRYYAPVIVRDEEGEGVRLWSFGKQVANELLTAMLGDYGDITDPYEGRDVKVSCSQPAGRQFSDLKVQPRLKTTELGTKAQCAEWLANVPNLEEIYQLISAEEIEKRVNDHLNVGADSDGTEGGSKTKQSTEITMEESADVDDVFSKLDKLSQED